jgi:hypothetical protein
MEIDNSMNKKEENKTFARAVVSDSSGFYRIRHLRLSEEKYKKLEGRLNTTDNKGYTLHKLEKMFE